MLQKIEKTTALTTQMALMLMKIKVIPKNSMHSWKTRKKTGPPTMLQTTQPTTAPIMPHIQPTAQMFPKTITPATFYMPFSMKSEKTIILQFGGIMWRRMLLKITTKHTDGPCSGKILMRMLTITPPTQPMPLKTRTKPHGGTKPLQISRKTGLLIILQMEPTTDPTHPTSPQITLKIARPDNSFKPWWKTLNKTTKQISSGTIKQLTDKKISIRSDTPSEQIRKMLWSTWNIWLNSTTQNAIKWLGDLNKQGCIIISTI